MSVSPVAFLAVCVCVLVIVAGALFLHLYDDLERP